MYTDVDQADDTVLTIIKNMDSWTLASSYAVRWLQQNQQPSEGITLQIGSWFL